MTRPDDSPGFDEEQAKWSAESGLSAALDGRAYRYAYLQDALEDVDWETTALEARPSLARALPPP
ncbi:MAG: hypothetical protein U5K56_07040 [Halioglobus sp.]|nr:hypothetical protein [Halioglobus sp.]